MLGELTRDQGDYAGALEHYRSCLTRWADRENIVHSAIVFDDIARTLVLKGEPAAAVRLMGATAAIRAGASVKLTGYEQATWDNVLAACRERLGETGFARAWNVGRALTGEQATARALRIIANIPYARLQWPARCGA